MRLEELTAGQQLAGVIPAAIVEVVAVVPHGADAVQLVYRDASGCIAEEIVYRSDEHRLGLAESSLRPFDAAAADFKLAAEAQRIRLAGLYDPMLAVTTSAVQPLPHQIRAVYGEILPRTPLRFLLADDPGAGKTIMAGLYIKELLLRGDVQRCLVIAPGGLVEQWQDELYLKFSLRFEILDPRDADGPIGQSAFEHHPLLIARMDQLARNETLLDQLDDTDYDLVVVDEAHRMSAHYFGSKLEKSKRFQLGERLRQLARHLLLMTATPHAGKEDDFQLFMSLLDRDRFEGRVTKGVARADTQDMMRRMVKEDLLTFEGKPLFPERNATTVPYELTDAEAALYEQVTRYVREGMNRAADLDDKRRHTVGFALTVLQRRLASSPEAIYQSLVRRADRLERSKKELLDPSLRRHHDQALDVDTLILDDPDEYTAAELEDIEEDIVDAATAARTVQELDAELAELADLITAAAAVRASGTDRKWTELRGILQDQALAHDAQGSPRKLITFTEHRDTLAYLQRRIATLLGKAEAVQAIHGGVNRTMRRQITEQFTKNPDCQILLATDAAGEGLNLQAAHLMVNYDLPWNPNRIEQRFGRIHRIGQREVCQLWNIVAANTREGAVFTRLLDKIDEQRKAYGGKVFDVLGVAFTETPLRDLLIEAIRYGEQPEVRARMEQVIDAGIADGLNDLMAKRALANESLAEADLFVLRRQLDEAKARRLQPHYIQSAFTEAFRRLGGRIARREKGRYEISHVPAAVRQAAVGPVATRYERVTFDLDSVEVDSSPVHADLLAPGHPLHDTVMDLTVATLTGSLETGTTLVSATIDEPRLLVGVVEQVVDATGASVAKRFGYAFVAPEGTATLAGPAPYLDCVAAPDTDYTRATSSAAWLADAEHKAVSWVIEHQLPEYLAEVSVRRTAEIDRATHAVKDRLNAEINRLSTEALAARDKEELGQKVRESSESLTRKANDLEARLSHRLAVLAKQAHMTTKPPRVVAAALVLPLAAVDTDLPPDAPMHAVDTKDVERRGIEAVLKAEQALGRHPEEQAFNNPGYDVLSTTSCGDTIRIEVKARIQGAEDFFITHNEVLTGKNAAPHYRLALVSVSPDGPEHDDVRYVLDPFATTDLGGLEATGLRIDWDKTWVKGTAPQ